MSHPNPSEAGQEKNSAGTDMELRRRLLSCMAETLTSAQYQVCVLNLLEGMPQKDIASEFGLPPVSRIVPFRVTVENKAFRRAGGVSLPGS